MQKTLCFIQNSKMLRSFMMLCYLVISLVLPFQHQHTGEDTTLAFAYTRPKTSKQVILSAFRAPVCKAQSAHTSHCFACEWQNTEVSSILPPTSFPPHSLSKTFVSLALPRYSNGDVYFRSARAPPIA